MRLRTIILVALLILAAGVFLFPPVITPHGWALLNNAFNAIFREP